jgi:EAL domain-containing protein (putative c-di-GMP-specific phosphodiesterase class I)
LTGYEVLGRSRIFGLQTPKQMFSAASQLNLENELSRAFRRRGVEVAQQHAVEDRLYVNTHPAELNEPDLIESLHELRSVRPHLPITLEIHEASVTNREMIRSLRDALTDLDIGLAFDDFGAGQARLVELSEARPDCVKFDMSLVQGIHHAPPSRQEVLALLIKMVNDLGIASLAEGVETWEDHETLAAMGVRLGQGFIYGRPASIKSFSP